MSKVVWEEEKEKIEEEALAEHDQLSRLFREDRFAFEREKKRMIDEIINSANDEAEKNKLRALNDSWDRKLKNAGSRHNRFVLAQSLFWEHFHEVWQPTIEQLNSRK